MNKMKIWAPLVGAALLVVGIWIGYMIAGGKGTTPAQQKLNKVFELIADEYVDEVSMDSIVELTIPQLLQNLDPHSIYIPVDELDKMNRDLESSFFGVGIQFQLISDTICVVQVIEGGPAQHVGMLAGDRIIAVDGKPMTGKQITSDDVLNTLRGPKDTKVTVTVKRGNSARPLTFEIVRGEIPSVSVNAAYIVDGNVGYVRVTKFAQNTYSEFLQALVQLKADGAEKFIIDLRGNTGGLLDQAILMANEFLPGGRRIVEVRGRKAADNTVWLSDGTGIFAGEPLVVLTDEFSASSSEIVSGCIQDNDRGLIVGRRTFGKGLVQRQIVLEDSSQMRLTVQRYYTPSGRCIQKDFHRGDNLGYETEISDRYTHGEVFSADSIKVDSAQIFTTEHGRTVYGGGGIIPDVFVPNDTSNVTNYYISVANAGLLNKFAYEYCDLNREDLTACDNVDQLLSKLPPAEVLLQAFVQYAADNGVHKRWYYINISSQLIIDQLRALIASDILGMSAYYEIVNRTDITMLRALQLLRQGVPTEIDNSYRPR
ncbi:MAG: S41 family peptidase [Muribaculaceae bacterium]